MKRTDIKITRYKDGEFYIDIVELESTYEAWLSHNSYGISDLMFGVPKTQQSLHEFVELVEINLVDYERYYMTNL